MSTTLLATSHAGPSDGRSKKAVPPPSQTTTVQMHPPKKAPAPAQILSKSTNENAQQKKVSRRSSKPIINWFQRKLAGSGKAKRTENVPLRVADFGMGRSSSNAGHQMGRVTSSPLPVQSAHHVKQQARQDAASVARRKTRSISLYGDEDLRGSPLTEGEDNISLDQSSLNRESIWSPASAMEADDDASVRPIPPSGPPSPSPSRDSSSYLSDPRTFRSMAASTKPTTLLSIDLNGNGMAHIAQAPMNPPTPLNRFAPHVRQSSSLSNPGLLSSAGSITFSALPPAQPASRANSLRNPGSLGSVTLNTPQPSLYNSGQVSSVQAPLHTTHHPRNNPRPSSPPLDNASVLTLASSAFGISNRFGLQNYPPSVIGDTASHYGGSVTFPDAESASQYVPGDDDRAEERDFDASVRALRPRSSRRGSWESEASRWSARVLGTGTPSLARERSLWASNSVRTGHFSTGDGEAYEGADDQAADDMTGYTDEYEKNDSILEVNPPVEGISILVEEPQSLPTVSEVEPEKDLPSSNDACTSPEAEVKHVLSRSSTDTIALPVGTSSAIPTTQPQHNDSKEVDEVNNTLPTKTAPSL